MTDTVIVKQSDSMPTISDPRMLEFALRFKNLDKDNDSKVDKAESIAFVLAAQDAAHTRDEFNRTCRHDTESDALAEVIRLMQSTAQLAVNLGVVDEVTVPDVGNLCAKATELSI